MTLDLPIRSFKNAKDWQTWLEKNHTKPDGIWLKFYKKSSGIKSIYYPEALEVALCYGWIDAQAKGLDDKAYLQRFTPRRSKSVWSKVNTLKAERLIKEGRMKPAGLAAIKAAKADGRWEKAYHSSSTAETPKDFMDALGKNKKAKLFFESLSKVHKYAIYYRLNEAKRPETRAKRMKHFLDLMKRQEKFKLM
jgi:uncharacterized protein YdeI (YjbR/CyaY-like superfamily)